MSEPFYLGCHLSAAKGYAAMGKDALSIGANVFQFFTRNPRGGKAKDMVQSDVDAYLAMAQEHGFGKILAHASYTINPCSAEARTREFAHEVMADDLKRLEALPGNLYNFHPGSHVGQGIDAGIDMIVGMLNEIMWSEQQTTVLLETMAGKGSEVGSRFEELRRIIDGVKANDKIGVCLDTCHVSDAGYDVIENLDSVLDEFDAVVGLERLHAIHLNDSKNPRGAHKDRHETIGDGAIGLGAITTIINHPKLRHLPFYLETPNELPGYGQEIALLRSLRVHNGQ